MRGLWILIAALLAGCATTAVAPSPPVGHEYRFDQLTYEELRGDAVAAPLAGAQLRVDITLLDVDRLLALEVLGLDDDHSLEPCARAEPVGEILAIRALAEDRGEVLQRPSLWLQQTPHELEFERAHFYLDRKGLQLPGVVDTWREGARCTVKVLEADGMFSVSVDSSSAQGIFPVPTYESSTRLGDTVVVESPRVASMNRVAVESVSPGQTAAFFLSQARYREDFRVRLLLICLVDSGKG